MDVTPMPHGELKVEISFHLTPSGTLSATAQEVKGNGLNREVTIVQQSELLQETEIQDARKSIAEDGQEK